MNKNGRAWVMKGAGQLEFTNFPYPELREDGVIVKIKAAGVCGTDKHMYNGRPSTAHFPIIPGHEFMGEIEEVGSKADGNVIYIGKEKLEKGDRVVVAPGQKSCGKCPSCLTMPDRPYLCPNRFIFGFSSCAETPHFFGGLADYAYIQPGVMLFKVPDNVPDELAAIAEPTSVAIRIVNRAYAPGLPIFGNGMGLGRSVMVIGAGPIGLLVISVLKHVGAGNIIIADRIPERLALAKELGADVLVDASMPLEDRIKFVNANNGGSAPDIVIETAGAPVAFKEALEFVRRGGILVEAGHYTNAGATDIHPFTICNKDVDIRGSWAFPPMLMRDTLNFMSRTTIPLEKVVTHVMGLDSVEEALKITGTADASKVVVRPW